jgi:uncharacterized protein (DUF1501 family)
MEHMFSRRALLLHGARTLGAAALVSRFGTLSAMAQQTGDDYKALVCIFLNGGNDAFNMVAPYEPTLYAPYYNARPSPGSGLPSIALPREGPGAMLPIPGVVGGTNLYGLHPNLNNLLPLYTTPQSQTLPPPLAVVANVGTLLRPIASPTVYRSTPSLRPRSLFDHGIQTDTWQEVGADEGWGSGVGRILEQRAINHVPGATVPVPTIPVLVNVTSGASVYLTGEAPYITLPPGSQGGRLTLQGFGTNPTGATLARLNALRELYRIAHPDPVVKAISDKTNKAIDDGRIASQVLGSTTLNTVFPATGLGNQLKQVAILIKSHQQLGANRRQVFFASIGGFDTHEDQLTNHPNLMRQLGDAMAAFYAATVEIGMAPNVTTFTLSEFGRTVQNSGSGTDHAWGSHAFVMGGAVRGGQLYGQYPSLVLAGPDDIDTGVNARGRILPRTSVDQYAATLCKWFGLSYDDMLTFLPNLGQFSPNDLGFLQAS